MKKYDSMTRQELWDAMQTDDVKELRQIHKALKKYSRTDGIPLYRRYPDFPYQFSCMALVVVVVLFIIVSFM